MAFTKTSGVSGNDLRVFRVSRGVRQAEIAAAMGCGRTNVRRIEEQRRPTDEAVRRYLDAVRSAEAGE